MKSKTKHQHKKPIATPRVPGTGTGKRRLLLILTLLLAGGATWAVFEFVIWNKVPAELVGKWVVVEGPKEYEDAIFDFFRSGAMVARVNMGGKEGIINATIRVEGKNIFSSSKRPTTGEEKTSVQVIHTLTANELVVEVEKGKVLKMERAN